MAGVAAVRAVGGVGLKWPNDVLAGESKVGGILVERGSGLSVVGMGMNLWWASPPGGMAGLFGSDPGPERHAEIAALWGAELMEMIDRPGWPRDEYREACITIGRRIVWEPDGGGFAVDVAEDGALVVDTGDAGEKRIYSGVVRHVRSTD